LSLAERHAAASELPLNDLLDDLQQHVDATLAPSLDRIRQILPAMSTSEFLQAFLAPTSELGWKMIEVLGLEQFISLVLNVREYLSTIQTLRSRLKSSPFTAVSRQFPTPPNAHLWNIREDLTLKAWNLPDGSPTPFVNRHKEVCHWLDAAQQTFGATSKSRYLRLLGMPFTGKSFTAYALSHISCCAG
jgi:hypothetical protein